MKLINQKNYYTVKDIALAMGLSIPTMHSWVKRGEIKTVRFGAKNYISQEEYTRLTSI